jgi:hypothetical protein
LILQKRKKSFFTQKSLIPSRRHPRSPVTISTVHRQPSIPNVQTCKRSNVFTFHPSTLPPSYCSQLLKIQKQFNSNAQNPLFRRPSPVSSLPSPVAKSATVHRPQSTVHLQSSTFQPANVPTFQRNPSIHHN